MQLPFFFEENIPLSSSFTLNEETSRHIVQVLRMNKGEKLHVTNGRGGIITAALISANKKGAQVDVLERSFISGRTFKIIIGISLLKNKNRFEWFLEKAAEIGVSEIIPLLSERTEKQHFRQDRMKHILISAMLQSEQAWLPVLQEPRKYLEIIQGTQFKNKYIAHCRKDQKKFFASELSMDGDRLILIGPEGDFTNEEIEAALNNKFIAVSFGGTRLRTETAGLVAAVLFSNTKNN
jgi:16S rRNA (uracil1498-N3)-methyltransferase